MSNINAQNITVTNLTVTNINGLPYNPNNPCSNPYTTGYYVACGDCNISIFKILSSFIKKTNLSNLPTLLRIFNCVNSL